MIHSVIFIWCWGSKFARFLRSEKETYLECWQISITEIFCENSQQLMLFAKSSIKEVWQGSKHPSDIAKHHTEMLEGDYCSSYPTGNQIQQHRHKKNTPIRCLVLPLHDVCSGWHNFPGGWQWCTGKVNVKQQIKTYFDHL